MRTAASVLALPSDSQRRIGVFAHTGIWRLLVIAVAIIAIAALLADMTEQDAGSDVDAWGLNLGLWAT